MHRNGHFALEPVRRRTLNSNEEERPINRIQNGARQLPLHGTGVDDPVVAPGAVGRTKRLLLAALRVWELKRGIRD